MKAKIILLLAIVLCFVGVQAQDELIKKIEPVRSYDGVVVYQKTTQAAKMFEFNYPAKDLERAIQGYLEQRGAKIRNVKGLNVAKGILLHDSENRVYDVYYKVDGKGKGDKAVSTLSLILADPDENILLRTKPEAGGAAATEALPVFTGVGASGFFNDLGTLVGDYDHGKAVATYEEDYNKAQRRYDSLIEEGRNLEKRKRKLEQDISDNLDAQAKQAREVEKAKLLLDQLKARRRG